MSIVLNARDPNYRVTASSCPIHDIVSHRDRSSSTAFGRSKSIDSCYVRYDASSSLLKRRTFHREMAVDGRFRGRNPFKHSHSVGCAAVDGKRSQGVEPKAKSVTSLAPPPRPRPNVLELCPNYNTSYDSYRRRHRRASERSFDFDDCYLDDFGSTFANIRYSRRSSSRDSGRSFNNLLQRQQEVGQGRWNNIRKGLSLMSLCVGNDDLDEDDQDENYYRQSRILRPPTRHFHHRGISGLPVKCPAKYMGLAY